MDQAQAATKPSGLPRPSRLPTRLPVLAKKASSNSISSQPEVQPSSRPGVDKFRLPSKKPSASSLSRPNPEPRVTVPTPRKTATNGIGPGTATPSTSARSIPARPPSRLRRPPQAPPPANPAREREEHHDQLGSLDSFRAASRQGFYDDASPEEYVEPASEPPTPKTRKPSRPSLSDRTIESLQSVPSTPKERRRSSFFAVESPMGPPPRPSSALSRNGSSGNSRPSTSDGSSVKPGVFSSAVKRAPTSAKPAARTSLGGFGFTPNGGRRSVSTSFSTKLQTSSTKASVPPSPRPVSPSKPMSMAQKSKTFSARPSKPRPVLGDAFAPIGQGRAQAAKPKPTPASSPANSSTVLRQQIAAAKAAARKEREKNLNDSPQASISTPGGAYEYDPTSDPFNTAPKDGKHILRTRVNAARMSGKLNIAAMGLKTIPDEVMHMFDAAAMEESKVNWAEVVDLIRFIAADNELEEIEADVFPDTSIDDFNMIDEAQGNQFGGLEFLDLHGNSLVNIPLGLRRLERLTSLNLTHNKLDNSVLEVISQIKPLKELKLGNNNISGHLPTSICELTHLETLELQANRLLALPEALRGLTGLRVLNISGNQLTALPMEAMQQLPLVDLDVSSNALIGSLFPLGGASEHLTLRSLNLSNNSLAALTFSETVFLPQLRTLNVTNNHFTSFPPVGDWSELITLAAGDNKITQLPEGFTTLTTRLRNVNFSGNSLNVIPPQVANMESLESLILASNPLRDKKYLIMNATDIKRDLRAKLEPAEGEEEETGIMGDGENGTNPGPSGSKWTVGANGLLDLSGQDITDNDIDAHLATFLSSNSVRQLLLQNNKLTTIPAALSQAPDLKILDLSNNPFDSSNYLSTETPLPNLQELRLRSCRLSSLEPLPTFFSSPKLQTLDLSANRLSGPVPALREVFPALTTLIASDNKFSSVSADALRGFTTLNLGSNDLQSLPAEIGLLWDEGLKSLEVGRNAFRVPGFRVLEKGTEAVLRYLRDRLPAVGGEGELD